MFPVRSGTATEWLTPDRLATIMIPQIRMAAIQLDGIPDSEREYILFQWAQEHTGRMGKEGKLIDVDPIGLTFTIRVVGSEQDVRIPLSAFKVLDDEHMRGTSQRRVHIEGFLSENNGRWQWNPRYR